MNKDYKAKLLEKAGIYVDCCQLLKCVYKLLFSMPKKDRVIIGDKIIEYNLSMIAHFSKGFQFKECRLAEIDSFLFDFDRMKALCRKGFVLYWNSEKNSFSTKELKHS